MNGKNEVVVTIQENNHLVVGDLASGTIVASYSAGKYHHEGRDDIMAWLSSSMASEL